MDFDRISATYLIAGGITAIRQASEVAVGGHSLQHAPREHPELRHSIEKLARVSAGPVAG